MPRGGGAIGIPTDLSVVVGVQIDEPGRHDEPGGVDYPLRNAIGAAADFDDAAVFDPQIALVARHPRAVHDRAPRDVQVVFVHAGPLL